MKPVLLLLASLVLVVLVFLSGVVITANVIAEPEPHRFAHMDTPDLWTSRPKKVDPSKQSYERLPSATPPVSVASDTAKTSVAQPSETQAAVQNPEDALDKTVTGSVPPQSPEIATPVLSDLGEEQQRSPVADPAHAQWCYARYRSYRIEDNSYQPYGGGARRQCQSPGGPVLKNAAAAPVNQRYQRGDQIEEQGAEYAEPQTVGSDAPAGAHEEWCFDRYRSYRVEDNSYQPFDGGPRRACRSPYG